MSYTLLLTAMVISTLHLVISMGPVAMEDLRPAKHADIMDYVHPLLHKLVLFLLHQVRQPPREDPKILGL